MNPKLEKKLNALKHKNAKKYANFDLNYAYDSKSGKIYTLIQNQESGDVVYIKTLKPLPANVMDSLLDENDQPFVFKPRIVGVEVFDKNNVPVVLAYDHETQQYANPETGQAVNAEDYHEADGSVLKPLPPRFSKPNEEQLEQENEPAEATSEESAPNEEASLSEETSDATPDLSETAVTDNSQSPVETAPSVEANEAPQLYENPQISQSDVAPQYPNDYLNSDNYAPQPQDVYGVPNAYDQQNVPGQEYYGQAPVLDTSSAAQYQDQTQQPTDFSEHPMELPYQEQGQQLYSENQNSYDFNQQGLTPAYEDQNQQVYSDGSFEQQPVDQAYVDPNQQVYPENSFEQQPVDQAYVDHSQQIYPENSFEQQPVDQAYVDHSQQIYPENSFEQQPVDQAYTDPNQQIYPDNSFDQQPLDQQYTDSNQQVYPENNYEQQPLDQAYDINQQAYQSSDSNLNYTHPIDSQYADSNQMSPYQSNESNDNYGQQPYQDVYDSQNIRSSTDSYHQLPLENNQDPYLPVEQGQYSYDTNPTNELAYPHNNQALNTPSNQFGYENPESVQQALQSHDEAINDQNSLAKNEPAAQTIPLVSPLSNEFKDSVPELEHHGESQVREEIKQPVNLPNETSVPVVEEQKPLVKEEFIPIQAPISVIEAKDEPLTKPEVVEPEETEPVKTIEKPVEELFVPIGFNADKKVDDVVEEIHQAIEKPASESNVKPQKEPALSTEEFDAILNSESISPTPDVSVITNDDAVETSDNNVDVEFIPARNKDLQAPEEDDKQKIIDTELLRIAELEKQVQQYKAILENENIVSIQESIENNASQVIEQTLEPTPDLTINPVLTKPIEVVSNAKIDTKDIDHQPDDELSDLHVNAADIFTKPIHTQEVLPELDNQPQLVDVNDIFTKVVPPATVAVEPAYKLNFDNPAFVDSEVKPIEVDQTLNLNPSDIFIKPTPTKPIVVEPELDYHFDVSNIFIPANKKQPNESQVLPTKPVVEADAFTPSATKPITHSQDELLPEPKIFVRPEVEIQPQARYTVPTKTIRPTQDVYEEQVAPSTKVNLTTAPIQTKEIVFEDENFNSRQVQSNYPTQPVRPVYRHAGGDYETAGQPYPYENEPGYETPSFRNEYYPPVDEQTMYEAANRPVYDNEYTDEIYDREPHDEYEEQVRMSQEREPLYANTYQQQMVNEYPQALEYRTPTRPYSRSLQTTLDTFNRSVPSSTFTTYRRSSRMYEPQIRPGSNFAPSFAPVRNDGFTRPSINYPISRSLTTFGSNRMYTSRPISSLPVGFGAYRSSSRLALRRYEPLNYSSPNASLTSRIRTTLPAPMINTYRSSSLRRPYGSARAMGVTAPSFSRGSSLTPPRRFGKY
ncbi:hypothetical protein [[Mycoplasma] testudinis]|uniref:hypothetical protein n=1 Tax=[Mycoplasma] testudinis TaxID=33924 RepID=UPI00048747FC|nr:hypothetical protein [[Mycoplasma] testudinis]